MCSVPGRSVTNLFSKTMKMKSEVLLACVLAMGAYSVHCGEGSAHSTASPIGSAVQNASFSGKVIETMNAGGYTYVRVESGTNKIWAAAPKTEAKVGDTVGIVNAMA